MILGEDGLIQFEMNLTLTTYDFEKLFAVCHRMFRSIGMDIDQPGLDVDDESLYGFGKEFALLFESCDLRSLDLCPIFRWHLGESLLAELFEGDLVGAFVVSLLLNAFFSVDALLEDGFLELNRTKGKFLRLLEGHPLDVNRNGFAVQIKRIRVVP